MLFPRVSIRLLLAVTALCGVFFGFLALAIRGHVWAISLVVPIGGLVLAFACYAGLFVTANLLWQLRQAISAPKRATSPFANETPPPRLVKAEDPP